MVRMQCKAFGPECSWWRPGCDPSICPDCGDPGLAHQVLPRIGLTVAAVLTDWGLADPVRDAVALILGVEGARDAELQIKTVGARIKAARGVSPDRLRNTGINRARDHLASDAVARAFRLSPQLAGALWELKWAAYSETIAEARGHLDAAQTRLERELVARAQPDHPRWWWAAPNASDEEEE